MKSNIPVGILLLSFLLPFHSFASWAVRDTIILDGDTVFIAKRERVLNIDSLQTNQENDIITKKTHQYRSSIGIEGGFSRSIGSFQSAYENLEPLDNFIHHQKSKDSSPILGIDFGYCLQGIHTSHGNLFTTLHTGLRYHTLRIHSSVLNESQFTQDSLISLEYIDQELFLHYFTIFDSTSEGIIGEIDTTIIQTQRVQNSFKTLDIPFKVRVTFQPMESPVSFFGEIGVLYRILQSHGREISHNYLVNSQSEIQRFDNSVFTPSNFFTPIAGFGLNYHFTDKGYLSKHWSVGLSCTATFPFRTVNPEGYFNIKSRSSSLFISIRKTL